MGNNVPQMYPTYCLGLIINFLKDNEIPYQYESNNLINNPNKYIKDGVKIEINNETYLCINTHVDFVETSFASVILHNNDFSEEFSSYDKYDLKDGYKRFENPEELFESLKKILNK